MRELKFRYWDSYANRLVCTPIVFGSTLEGYFSLGGRTWEQYTGLKDKNGKEIYEGDIICDKKNKVRSKIVWNEENLCFDNKAEPDEWGLSQYTEMLTRRTAKDFEVIGNVHENQDLLGDTNVTNKEEE